MYSNCDTGHTASDKAQRYTRCGVIQIDVLYASRVLKQEHLVFLQLECVNKKRKKETGTNHKVPHDPKIHKILHDPNTYPAISGIIPTPVWLNRPYV